MRFLFALGIALALLGPAQATARQDTLAQIKETSTMRIGFRKSEPPMSFVDAAGRPAGYSIDLCNRIAAGVRGVLKIPELEIEYVPVESTNRFSALGDNTIDILCGSTTKTIRRGELVDFTSLTFVTGAGLMSLKANGINEIGDLQGKRVGVVRETTTATALQKAMSGSLIEAQIVNVGTASAGLQALKSGEVDAFASDQVVLIGLILTSGERDIYSLSPQLYSFEPFALAVRRNDSDFRLVADAVLAQLYRSGAINGIYDKWFGKLAPEQPNGLKTLYMLGATPR